MENANNSGTIDTETFVRNSLQPIGRIPVDVLMKIFSLVTDDGNVGEHTKRLLRLTWVSSTWRRVALESKGLWAYIDSSNYRWATVWMDRAGGALLSVELDKDSVRFGLHNILNSVSHRLKRLQWRIPYRGEHLLSTWTTASPYLERLALKDIHLPDGFLRDRAPAIQHLSLHSCHFDFTRALTTFSHLTVLTVENPGQQPSLQSLLRLLEGMPRLVELVLCRAFDEQDIALAHTQPPRSSDLVYLRLRAGVEAGLLFLNSFSLIREQTALRVQLDYPMNNPIMGLQNTLIAIIPQLLFTSSRSLTSMTLGGSQAHFPTLKLAVEFSSTSPQPSIPIPPVRYAFSMPFVRVTDLATAAQGAFNLSQLHTLRILAPHMVAFDGKDLASIFGPCPQLRRLDLRCSRAATGSFLASLIPDPTPPVANGPPQPVHFPVLEVCGSFDDQQFGTLLACALTVREEEGRKLRGLVLGKKSVTWPSNLVDHLSALVDEVIVEGSEKYLEFIDHDPRDEEDDDADPEDDE
ncbi:hypothetical protein BDN72DRAFT_860555 [Pluteus cervinus]|uniref:Uncharacterized protein n=1 Tax=Pluteus cervinus TaxID=181527 RepID=A0ACD3AID5_9AGAR|nr:hypothetical protein BDN72DRAFT_860555 [Pluteus cervinus]